MRNEVAEAAAGTLPSDSAILRLERAVTAGTLDVVGERGALVALADSRFSPEKHR